jgi:hypothetical protein
LATQLLTSVETDLRVALGDDAATVVAALASERTAAVGEVIASWELEMPESSVPILVTEQRNDWQPCVEEEWSIDVHHSVAGNTRQTQMQVKDLFSAQLPSSKHPDESLLCSLNGLEEEVHDSQNLLLQRRTNLDCFGDGAVGRTVRDIEA